MRALLAAVSTFLPAASLLATTITVNSLTDASGCSLRNAIVAANTNAASGGCTACIGVRVVTGAATISNNYIGTDHTGVRTRTSDSVEFELPH